MAGVYHDVALVHCDRLRLSEALPNFFIRVASAPGTLLHPTGTHRFGQPLASAQDTMLKVNMCEAKTQLSKLVERVLAGESVIIAKFGMPVVRLVPTSIEHRQRRPGLLEGKIRMAPDFDQTREEISSGFERE